MTATISSSNSRAMISITFFIISSLAWQSCWGLSCYSCSTLVDNGVIKPGNQTCDMFHSSSQERRQKFMEVCPVGVKACSHSSKRGIVGQSSGTSYDIIKKGCYAQKFVNQAKINQCEDLVGSGSSNNAGTRDRVCLCDTDFCLMDPEKVVVDEDHEPGRKSGAGSGTFCSIVLILGIFTRIL